MKDQPFRLTDWHRFLFGNASWPFLFEVLLRTCVTYALLIVAMRLLGRRVAGQYTLFEISIAVTLAAAVGVPLQAANRGLLPPIVIAIVVILLQRVIARIGSTHRRIETAISADVTLLASEGRLAHAELVRTAMPREKVFEAMRAKGWQHLGQISRLYMEPSGSFSFIPARPSRPGLSVLPAIDEELRAEGRVDGCCACVACGHTVQASERENCEDDRDDHGDDHGADSRERNVACECCGSHEWTYAVTEVER